MPRTSCQVLVCIVRFASSSLYPTSKEFVTVASALAVFYRMPAITEV